MIQLIQGYSKREKISFFLNFIVGFVLVLTIPSDQSFFSKLPVIVLFPILYYLWIRNFLRTIRAKNSLVIRFFVILGWLLLISFATIFIVMLNIFNLHADMADNLIQLIVTSFFGSFLGLCFMSPVWGVLTLINFLILRRASKN